ncbi:MAG TPA: thiamine pyrophosphate-binding protein [Longimicrobiales bacterium]|nr:thiamine pyrophosphate-binding protein [Longimicrobiales bacterium]
MPKLSGGDIVVRALEDERIPFTFGIPGTHNIELYDALARSKSVRPILVTDEQSASFMADGVWRASGQMACANLVPGAGLTHALSGIAEAFLDNVPMLVLGCGIRRDTKHAYQLHDIDQIAIAKPVTKAQFRPDTGQDLYHAIRRACAIAREGVPGPVFVEVPANLYLFTSDVDFAWNPIPQELALEVNLVRPAAEVLNAAKRPLLYVGMGAVNAAAEIVALAECLDAPVATTFSGKGVFPENHPLALWPGFGEAAPRFARDVASECDATLAIGCRFGEVGTGSYGLTPPRPLIHVDIDPGVLGRNYETDVAIASDARAFVDALMPFLSARRADARLREQIRAGHEDVEHEWLEHKTDRVSPYRLMNALQKHFGPNTVFTADSGNGLFLGMECLRLEKPRRFLGPVDYSCMGYSVPAGLGAKLAAPTAPVVALAGDGAFLMTGLEMITAVSEAIPLVIIVLRDRELAQIAQFQQTALSRKACSELGDYDVTTLANAVGLEALRLDHNEEIDAVLIKALDMTDAGKAVVIDVAIDYSLKTHFTKGVIKTNLLRLPWADRLRFIGRAVTRKILP